MATRRRFTIIVSSPIAPPESLEPALEAALEMNDRIARGDVLMGFARDRYMAMVGTRCATARRMRAWRRPPLRPAARRDSARRPKEEHRHEDDADAQARDQGWHGDLRCAAQDRVAHPVPFLEIALHVLDCDRRAGQVTGGCLEWLKPVEASVMALEAGNHHLFGEPLDGLAQRVAKTQEEKHGPSAD
jgi:hypothetical protein